MLETDTEFREKIVSRMLLPEGLTLEAGLRFCAEVLEMYSGNQLDKYGALWGVTRDLCNYQ